jgi:hypothetical protein
MIPLSPRAALSGAIEPTLTPGRTASQPDFVQPHVATPSRARGVSD